ncbi:MAG: 3-oxoacyl-ACP reductase FabG [Gemmataceae bacterium]|nr:3-oxoacyl-ACP reductase FabG [Gemmataceae bacterium]
MRLKDKVAVITGASRGIGRGIAELFAAEGAKIAAVYRGSQAAAEEMVAGITAKGGVAKAFQADVSDLAQVKALFETIESEVGPVDILVNNAGIIHDDLFVRMDPADWAKVIQTNLFGTYNCCHQVGFPMMRRRSGRIINISSVAAEFVNMGQTNYAASKGAINSFTMALAVELAPRGVTVNAIAPGFIETDMSAPVRNKAGDAIQKMIPLKRLGKPEDIANVALFLASAAGGYMTGQVLTVDGGLSLGPVVSK